MRIILFFILTVVGIAQAKEWHGIMPLHSTRADVEKLLGASPTGRRPDAISYETANERVFVRYSTGNCVEKWNIPTGTVIFLDIYPKKKPQFSELKLDLSRYKKVQDPELPDYYYYRDDKKGYEITMNNEEDFIESFTYYGTADDAHLRCSESSTHNK